MGLDVGDRRIGVAVSDPDGLIAQGIVVITRTNLSRDIAALGSIIREQGVEKVVVGLPRRMDGSIGPQAEKAQAFGRTLQESVGVQVVFWDERLTTAEAERVMISAGTRRAKRKSTIDMAAATILLQSYLDYASRGVGAEGQREE